MEDIHSLRQTLEACQARFDNKISPAIEAADQAVQEYGFSSYMDLMAEMMRLSKTIVAAHRLNGHYHVAVHAFICESHKKILRKLLVVTI